MAETESEQAAPAPQKEAEAEQPFVLSDRIFVRHKERMIKIMLTDILYVEADRNYSRISTKGKEHLLSSTLKTIEEKLTTPFLLRMRRSYLVNID